jgi:aldehyde:ferredoxin oxidoreductase
MAAHAKNLEMPAYDPRGNYGMALGYATSERGACHLRSFTLFEAEPFKVKEMTRAVIENQNNNAVKWSMGLCDFWGTVDTSIMADFLTKGLGKKVSARDLDRVGERIWNLTRLFNIKAGFTTAHDTVSDKILKKSLENGPYKGKKIDSVALVQMKALLYHIRGWDKKGHPTKEKLAELGL